MNTIFYLIIYFTVYSFLGWVCETIYCSLLQKKFANRGFLNGPFCPIYGSGAIVLILCLTNLKNNIFLLFIFSVIITSILEYITSYVMEIMFHAKWWDYSDNKFNINGRICLKNSLIFGVMSVVFMLFVHTHLHDFVHSLSIKNIRIIAIILFCYFVIDVTISVVTIIKINITLSQLQITPNIIEKFEKCNGNNRFHVRKTSREISYKRLIHAFPNLKHNHHHESLEQIKEILKKKKII